MSESPVTVIITLHDIEDYANLTKNLMWTDYPELYWVDPVSLQNFLQEEGRRLRYRGNVRTKKRD